MKKLTSVLLLAVAVLFSTQAWGFELLEKHGLGSKLEILWAVGKLPGIQYSSSGMGIIYVPYGDEKIEFRVGENGVIYDADGHYLPADVQTVQDGFNEMLNEWLSKPQQVKAVQAYMDRERPKVREEVARFFVTAGIDLKKPAQVDERIIQVGLSRLPGNDLLPTYLINSIDGSSHLLGAVDYDQGRAIVEKTPLALMDFLNCLQASIFSGCRLKRDQDNPTWDSIEGYMFREDHTGFEGVRFTPQETEVLLSYYLKQVGALLEKLPSSEQMKKFIEDKRRREKERAASESKDLKAGAAQVLKEIGKNFK